MMSLTFGHMKIQRWILLYVVIMLVSLDHHVAQTRDAIDDIADKYQTWILGSSDMNYSNRFIETRHNRLMEHIADAEREFSELSNTIEPSRMARVRNDILLPLVLSYNYKGPSDNPNGGYQSEAIRANIIELYDQLHQSGWNAENDDLFKNPTDDNYRVHGILGLGNTEYNAAIGYATAVFLSRNFLPDDILEREMVTLNRLSAPAGPQFEVPVLFEVNGLNADLIIGILPSRLSYVLTLAPGEQRTNEMRYLQRIIHKALAIADGFADTIKSDFTVNHHKGVYLSAYGPRSLAAASVLAYILDGSPYRLNDTSTENLIQALLAARIYSNMYDHHKGAGGRAAHTDGPIILVPFFAHLAQLDTPYKSELKGAFARYWNPSHPEFFSKFVNQVDARKEYISTMGQMEVSVDELALNVAREPAPSGHWYFHYAGMSVHRRGEWAALWKGQGKYHWDYEATTTNHSSPENLYGKHYSAGALMILNEGKPAITGVKSGFQGQGWDWRRIPGTTALNTTYDGMIFNNQSRGYPANVFNGGLNLNEDGLSSIDFRDRLTSVRAKKSFFYFDEYIVALGTGISAGEQQELHTTLYQTVLEKPTDPNFLNDERLTGIGQTESFSDQAVFLTDATGNAYYVPNPENLVMERITQTAPNDSGKRQFTGDYVSARLLHGVRPQNASYEYYIHVDGGKKGARALSENVENLFTIHVQTEDAHVVEYKPTSSVGYALMTENKSTGQLVDQTDVSSMVMTTDTDQPGVIQIAVMNPEIGKIPRPFTYGDINNRQTWHAKPTTQPVTLTLKGPWNLLSGDGVSILSSDENATQIRFDCIDGQSVKATLQTDNIALSAKVEPQSVSICEEDSAEITIQLSGVEVDAMVNFSLINPPSGMELSADKNTEAESNQAYQLTFSGLNDLDSGRHDIDFSIESGDRSIMQKISIAKAQAISSPKLINPKDGSESVELQTSLTWEAADGASAYSIEISNSQSFDTFIVQENTSETSFTASNLDHDALYYWRVKAINPGDCPDSEFSEISSFKTIEESSEDSDTQPPPEEDDSDQDDKDQEDDVRSTEDIDQDGIVDAEDNCPQIPNPNQFDSDNNGIGNLCDTSSYRNITILISDVSCVGKNNGTIKISAIAVSNYWISLKGMGINTQRSFHQTDGIEFNRLQAGNYTISVGPSRENARTFDVTINEPPNLLVQTKVNKARRMLDLSLSGSDKYFIDINGMTTEINDSGHYSIPVSQDMVDLKVSTPNGCQGIYQEHLTFENKVRLYPNPVEEQLTVALPENLDAVIEIFNSSGQLVFKSGLSPRSIENQVDMRHLPAGLYVAIVHYDGQTESFKIIRQ
ncbi:MAG: chondroitinase family polysaccharide lyase [Flavobacteriaceae bacterium]|nr:chondroitinase family polysaccharide lyase [Flavobacteriaceae bacterium]